MTTGQGQLYTAGKSASPQHRRANRGRCDETGRVAAVSIPELADDGVLLAAALAVLAVLGWALYPPAWKAQDEPDHASRVFLPVGAGARPDDARYVPRHAHSSRWRPAARPPNQAR